MEKVCHRHLAWLYFSKSLGPNTVVLICRIGRLTRNSMGLISIALATELILAF